MPYALTNILQLAPCFIIFYREELSETAELLNLLKNYRIPTSGSYE